MKKFSALLFAILFTYLFATATVSAYSEEEILEMTKIGVGIICADEKRWDEETQEEKKVSTFGTFFAIGKPDKPVNYLVTNFHCVSDNDGNISESLYVYTNDPKKSYPVSVVKFDANYDFAILKSEEALGDIYPLTLAYEDAGLNDIVYIVGFPGEALLRESDNGQYYHDLDPHQCHSD